MKIVHINMDFLPSVGGAQVSVHQLALGQTEAGHDVTVLTNRKSARQMKGVLPYEVVPVFHRTSHMFRAADGWLKRVFFEFQVNWRSRGRKFDICHLHGAMPEGNFIEAFQKAGTKVVLTLRGDDIGVVPEIGYGTKLDPKKNAETLGRVRSCDAVIGLTEWGREEILSMGVPEGKAFALGNGVRLECFDSPFPTRQEMRKAYDVTDSAFWLISIGRYSPVKGYDLIPEAAQLLKKEDRNFMWTVIGPKTEALKFAVGAAGVGDCVRLCGPVVPSFESFAKSGYALPTKDMVGLLNAADAVAIPSLSETFCNNMAEAMAAGTPVIGSDIKGLTHLLKDGETGTTFPPGDPVSLAKAVGAVMDNQDQSARMAANAKASVAVLAWPTVVENHIKIYESLLND